MKKYSVLRVNNKGEVIGNCGVGDKNWMLNTIYKEIDYCNDDEDNGDYLRVEVFDDGYDDEEYED